MVLRAGTPALVAAGSLVVEVAIRMGVAALSLTAILVAVAVASRVHLIHREHRRRRVEARWRPHLLGALHGSLDSPPRLKRREVPAVLARWNALTDSITGEGRERLLRFARRCGLADAVLATLRRRRPHGRIEAVIAAGRLRDLRALPHLTRLVSTGGPILRAQAARALVSIDPASQLRHVVALIAEWRDCHPASARAIVAGAGARAASAAVAEAAVAERDPERQARLLRVLGALRRGEAADTARRVLAQADHPEVIAACLAVLMQHPSPQDAAAVRRLLDHPVAFVRVRAVAALGRLRVPGDEWHLFRMLSDPDWWVRYRAAHALVAWPRFDRRVLERVGATHPDGYARGALAQALSEVAEGRAA